MKKKPSTYFPAILLIAIGGLALTACGGEKPNNTKTGPEPAKNTTINATAILKHSPSGTADLKWDPATHVLTVKLSLSGLAPKSTHPVNIFSGDCRSAGKVLYKLDNVVADDTGVAALTTTVKDVDKGIPAEGWYMNVHNGPTLGSNDQSQAIACGEVANPNPSGKTAQQVQMTLANAFVPNESATGVVQLTLANKILTVKLAMSGLAPNSSHMVHIHTGSCASQGKALHELKALKADAMGNAISTTTITGVTAIPADWYINVHQSTDLSTQTGNNPVACGNVNVVH